MRIDWDPAKAEANWRKHGVRFEDAARVFEDPRAATNPDPRHSGEEPREITVGAIGVGDTIELVVAVVHVERDETLRIISARRATARERDGYAGRR